MLWEFKMGVGTLRQISWRRLTQVGSSGEPGGGSECAAGVQQSPVRNVVIV